MKNQRKIKRNLGQQYITEKGKLVKARQLKPLSRCRAKCAEKLTDEIRSNIFSEYWKLGSYDKRQLFVSSMMVVSDKASCRTRTNDPFKQRFRQNSCKYFLDANGKRIAVCRACFLKTLDETDNFIKTVISKKLTTPSRIPAKDCRGAFAPRNKISEAEIANVVSHIKSFPSYESHYTRQTNTNRYLAPNLTLQIMYNLYVQTTTKPVGRKIYANEFHKLKLAFKKWKTDTCFTCDKYDMKLKAAENDQERNVLTTERNSHHLAAETAYTKKKEDKILAKENVNIKSLTFDLQQCLPTPALSSSVAFYKRQLWTFNLTIHDNGTGESSHFLWNETISGRGANQIGSCIFKYVMALPSTIDHVVLYSDTCAGQNKNSHIAAMFLYLLTKASHIKTIDHKFMVPGHSHMEVDVDHSIIEKKKKKTNIEINHPHDWAQLIRASSKNFTVIEMNQSDFLDFASLLKGPLVLRKINTNGVPFKWHDVQWLRYDNQNNCEISYKTTLTDEEFLSLSLQRRGQSITPEVVVKPITLEPVPINFEKKKDILSMLELIPKVFHEFYKNLKTTKDNDIDPDLVEVTE